MLTRIHQLSIRSLSVAQSQLQAAIGEREDWKRKAEHLADVCETMQLVNRLKWLVSLSTLLLFVFVLSSLQKSMSKEKDIHQEYAKKMKELEMAAEEQETKMIYLTSQLQHV